MSEALTNAVHVAALAHVTQVDKAGRPYILHPVAVMRAVKRVLPDDVDAHVAAVLHDVIEDTLWRVEDLREWGISERAIELVLTLTRDPAETYNEFIDRIIAAGPVAMAIKLADINHNLGRIDPLPSDRATSMRARYDGAALRIVAGLKNHNAVD